MNKNCFSILFLLLIFSCENMETVVDLDVPETPPVLVLNAMLDTDEPVKLLISHSVGAFSRELPSCISDAEVLLYENNQLVDTLQVNLDSLINYYVYADDMWDSIPMNYYESDLIPNKNTNYKVEASHSSYPPITASTYIPDDLEVDYEVEIDVTGSPDEFINNDNGTPNDDSDDFKEYNPNYNPNFGGLNGVELNFDDNPSQDNFYRLKIYSSCFKEWETENGDIELDYFRGYLEMMSNDPSFESSLGSLIEGYSFIGNQVVFSDALFNGQEKNIMLDIDSKGWRYENCDTVRIQFSIFSSDTYSYYTSLNNHRQISIFGGEVIPVYSNVENGLGSLISINDQILQLKPPVEFE